MVRRVVCLFLAVLMLVSVSSASAAKKAKAKRYSYDFDLTFSLNADSFPRILRSGASGYADLVNRLGVCGNVAWNIKTNSMELNATLYFTDNESVTYPFKIFGIPSRLYITSPLIQNEVLFLNMMGLMEFSIKARNTLNIPLGYLAVLYPYATEFAFSGLSSVWKEIIGDITESRTISMDTLESLSRMADEQLQGNQYLQQWIQSLAEGSGSQSAVESVFYALPQYYHLVAGDQPLEVLVSDRNETWKNAQGQTLFTCSKDSGSVSVSLSLPPETYGYLPSLSYSSETVEQTVSFTACASLSRSAEAEEAAGGGETDSTRAWPDCLLDCTVTGSAIPLTLPADTSFLLSAFINGAAYPNVAFDLRGETKSDGSLTVDLYKPVSMESDPVRIFSCMGTILPGETRDIPNYNKYDFNTTYNVFSFNEASLAEFNSKVLPSLIRSVFSFVEAAPTSACQSFLDDLAEMGVLDMLLD